MSSIKTTARFAGLVYVIMSVMAVFGYLYVPSLFIVRGDAAATVQRITEGALLYRTSILVSLLGQQSRTS